MKDKAAIVESAQKLVAKGQVDKAISELEKLLSEGKDGNINNTIGDLYLKKGAQKEAVEFYSKAADIYKEDGFTPKAIALYKKILNIIPSDVNALIALGLINAEKGFTANAIENFTKAAEIHNRNNEIEKALDLYEKILHISPFDVNVRMKVIEIYLKLGLKERAATGYAAIASDYLEKGDANLAMEFYSKAKNIDPKNVSSLIGFSQLAEQENNPGKALEYLSQAASVTPDNRNLLLSYAKLAVKLNKTEDARKALQQLLEKDASDVQAKKILGTLYLKEGKLENAWRELLPCIEESMRDSEWADAIGLLKNFAGLHPIPVRERLTAIYRTKGDHEALKVELRNLANIYEEQKLPDEALKLYREALELDPGSISIKATIDDLENALGLKQVKVIETIAPAATGTSSTGHDKVTPSLAEIKETDIGVTEDEDYDSHYIAGVDYRRKGLLDDAIGEFRTAAKDPEKTLLSLRMIASCYMEKKDYPRAIVEFEKLLKSLSPDDERYLDMKYELAGVHINNNDYYHALEIYSEISARNPGFRDISKKMDFLKAQVQKPEDKPRAKRDRVSYI
ncbi:MAG: tetratricopeptide repeat protein [Nitrospirae bacterium]|nr:tetratricopeptide repeat protein [Nitrospirota bacterium]